MGSPVNDKVRLFPSARLGLVVLWFYGAVTFYLIRNNFGVSIVCMTIDPIDNGTSANNTTGVTPSDDQCEEVSQPADVTGEFYWDRTLRGLMSSAFFVGYMVTNFFGGILAQKLGAKWVHFGGLAFATVVSVLCPVTAKASEWAMLTMRILLGFGCGTFIPSIREMISNWSPVYEKSTLYSMQSSGYAIGSVVAFSLSGALCDNLGWESTFYVPALFTTVYLILLAVLASNGPETSRCIPDKERAYIVKERTQKTGQELSIPWVGIFTSVPCWSIFICNFCAAWGSYTILTSGAQYMNDVLKFDIKSNGGYNALPQVCKFIVNLFAGFFIDFIRRKEWLSTTHARKLAQSLSMPVSAAMMIGIGFMTCENRGAAIAMLCIGEGFSGFGVAGVSLSIMEIAPRFVPVLGGIGNSFSQLAGIICPTVAGVLTTNGTQKEWQRVFVIGAAIYIFGWLSFIIFSSADVQPWATTGVESERVGTSRTKRKDGTCSNECQIIGKSFTEFGKSNDGFVFEKNENTPTNNADILPNK